MMNRQKYIDYIVEKLNILKAEILSRSKLNLTDDNIYCESLIKDILNICYDLDLKNINQIKTNFPGIDLADTSKRISYQVTSDKTSKKINNTLITIDKYKLYELFDEFFFFILSDKQTSYTINLPSSINFDGDKNIIDFDTIFSILPHIKLSQIIKLYDIVQVEFENTSKYIYRSLKVKEDLKAFLTSQINILKKNGKYIPQIYTDISRIKEKARYFIIPRFYFKNIQELEKVTFRSLNEKLIQEGIKTLNIKYIIENPYTNDSIVSNSQKYIDWLEKCKSRIKETRKTIEDFVHFGFTQTPTPREAWELLHYQYIYDGVLDSFITNFKLIAKPLLIITSSAGKGKTNFLCDFAENVITPRGFDCIFISANELNNIDLDHIDDFIIRRVFKRKNVNNFKEFASIYRNIFNKTGKPIVIIIDGLNEHTKLVEFSTKLELFTEEIIQYPFIKLIYSCRTEFFKERFNNFLTSNISNKTEYFRSFNRNITDEEKKQLFVGYCKYFMIKIHSYREEVYQTLTNNVLLLRIFCEAIGNPNNSIIKRIPLLNTLYKEEIFRLYLHKKQNKFKDLQKPKGPLLIKRKKSDFDRILDLVISYMLKNQQYSKVPIDNLINSDNDEIILSQIIDEDIIFRKDIGGVYNGGESDSSDLVSFTYDEFRDYLISRFLINNTYSNNPADFDKYIHDITNNKLNISEGVSRYLFHISKRNNNKSITDIIIKHGIYEKVFCEEIFQTEEDLINEFDINHLKREICTNKQKAANIVYNLILRRDIDYYKMLNVQILYKLIIEISDEDYNKYISPIFYLYYDSFYSSQRTFQIDVTKYLDKYSEIFYSNDIKQNDVNDWELLVILLGCDNNIANRVESILSFIYNLGRREIITKLVEYKDETKVINIRIRLKRIIQE